MTLTYALHRGFSDLGPAMTEHWQIFLNADFILADGSLRAVIGHLSRGQRIVASPSYCTIAEEVTPELRKHLDAATSTLSISHRELARLILQHRHTVIRGKTVNQTPFHMRYADQFYWSVDDTHVDWLPDARLDCRAAAGAIPAGAQLILGFRAHLGVLPAGRNICVIGDSDEFTMLELRDKSVAEDQIVPGPPDKKAIAERMVTWVTPYQQHFLKFPLTLHDGDLPPNVDDARAPAAVIRGRGDVACAAIAVAYQALAVGVSLGAVPSRPTDFQPNSVSPRKNTHARSGACHSFRSRYCELVLN